MSNRILENMKVTAILPDELIKEVQNISGAKNITESLNVALTEWVKLARIRKLNEQLERSPIHFQKNYSAEKVRKLNRKAT